MKKIALALMLLPCIGNAQTTPRRSSYKPSLASSSELNETNIISLPAREDKIFYEFIDSAFVKSKTEVFMAAKIWFSDMFVDSKNVLRVDDKSAGELAGKGTFQFSYKYKNESMPSWCQFSVKISCRDNRYRIQIYDILFKTEGAEDFSAIDGMNGSKEEWMQSILHRIDPRITAIIRDSKENITKKADTF